MTEARDLRRVLLDLVAPTRVGEPLAEGLVLRHASAELGLRLVIVTEGREVAVEVDAIGEGRPHAARSRHFTFGYRLGDRTAPTDGALGQRVCARVAEIVARNEDAVVAAIAATSTRDARVREVRGETLLEPAGQGDERFYTLSPYVGCLIGCTFCYAPSRLDPLRRLAGLAPVPWGSWVDVRVDAAEVLRRELATLPPWPIKLCPIVSDPYHAIEARLALTRRCLEVIAARGAAAPSTILLTRATLVTRDAEVLAALPRAWVGMSIPTIDDAARAHFEPRGATIAERLATLATLRAAGVTTCAVIQPQLPGEVDALADALAAVVSSVSLDVLRGEEDAGPLFDDPRFVHARDAAWQADQRDAVRDALVARGVAVWDGELPPEA